MDEIAAGAQPPSAVALQATTGVPSLTSQLIEEMAGGAGTPTDIYSHEELIDETAVVEEWTPTLVYSPDELIDETAVECTPTEVDIDRTPTPAEVYSHEPVPTEVYSHEPTPTEIPQSQEGSNSEQ